MSRRPPPVELPDGAQVAVVGGGPAGAFFSIRLLREARRRGRSLRVTVFERRRSLALAGERLPPSMRTSCNFCAGGISPRMSDVLDELGIEIPSEIVQNRIRTITIQSHWKNIQLEVPQGRRMFLVYRGSRPRTREQRHRNFDSLLLSHAAAAGARVVTGDVTSLARAPDGRPLVTYLDKSGEDPTPGTLPSDLVVFAGGVNHMPGRSLEQSDLVRQLADLMPGFRPPNIRRTLIFEVELGATLGSSLAGELYFILYGSRHLRIEMGSLMPKGRFVTVVLIGPDIDRADRAARVTAIVQAFLDLPHIRRVMPRRLVRRVASCVCRPNMVVGAARRPFGDRVAAVGDMVTSRLYKDGIHTAWITASGLADAVLESGVDTRSLRAAYGPVVRRLKRDHWFGRRVFATNAVAFRQAGLSRITYQAVVRERRNLPRKRRKLEGVLWRIASGDDTYRGIFADMFHPMTLFLVLTRGAFITARNSLTELAFGLSWRGFGRYATGISREKFVARVAVLRARLGIEFGEFRDFLRMYTIRIRASARSVYSALGTLGDRDRGFLRPRFVDIHRTEGGANELGSVVRYRVAPSQLSLKLKLSRRKSDRLLLYRVIDGFAAGGVLIFDIEALRPGECLLSILVGFNFRGRRGSARLLRHLFPTFVHDVLWNHSLCQLKDVVEREELRRGASPDAGATD